MSDRRAVVATRDELEAGRLVLELALGVGAPNTRPPAELRELVGALERRFTAALEQPDGPSIAVIEHALDVLLEVGLVTVPGVPADVAVQLIAWRRALDFYADHGQYDPIPAGEAGLAGIRPGDARVVADRGARARSALKLAEVTR